MEINSQTFEKTLPNRTCENGVPISDNNFWHPMQFENIVKVESDYVLSFVRVRQSYEMRLLSKSIHHNQNDIFPLNLWQTFYKVH